MSSVEQSDETFTDWMRDNLRRAAEHFGVTVSGDPLFGWNLRSVSASAWTHDGEPRWLRVCSEHSRWIREMPELWTGNAAANDIDGVPKPRIVGSLEWDVPDEDRGVRADLMTRVPGLPCSPTDALRLPLKMPDAWWTDLRLALTQLSSVHTERFATPAAQRQNRVRQIFGDHLAEETQPQRWETAHGDLHWANVFGPDLAIIDWELWGRAPVGTDAATLYLFALLVPDTAAHLYDVFADVLDSPDGCIAQVGVAARILHRAQRGEFPDLADAVQLYMGDLFKRHRQTRTKTR